jgi:hypothetical protein
MGGDERDLDDTVAFVNRVLADDLGEYDERDLRIRVALHALRVDAIRTRALLGAAEFGDDG